MTWSQWFVTPAVTSLFFLLGVLTLYWFLTNQIIRFYKKRGKHPDAVKIRTNVGVIYMVLLNVGVQLAVNGTAHSWVFINFQIFAIVFVSYFLKLNIRLWELVAAVFLFMGINGTFTYFLSWLYAIVLVGLFYVMSIVREHRHHSWVDYLDYTLASLVGSMILWGVIGKRLSLSTPLVLWEILFSFFILTIMYIYVDSLMSGAATLAQLTYTTNYDELTKVKNYFSFKNDFNELFQRSKITGHPLTLMLFDIDHFKHVNDTYGHLTGDYVLSHTAALISQHLQEIDPHLHLYRTGGEEFTILFQDYTTDQARAHVQAIADGIRAADFQHNGQHIHVSISVGVTQLQTADQGQLDVYRRADQNLYFSKRNGRDQVTFG
ncbi:MAG: GGDEF domain-containing protein [Levilactobacillus sp.]|jgi:diguanylate cyclase (GGDEF)-like protein|uniref:GGDEF domain-containing protein n=1 Tax=Levilactobacillus suantsaiihabitans TaxID=2487722 RepID=A0A4Z0J9Q3_9LACO|nr:MULTISPECIES: GGDEF domain-containing protein [Levilactobacillus]MCH4124124.1 GGDEF domain-containing protein [Levilactobacillus sp.]MCI1554040.1 GGDEF domain-containing protein [Levilactobacillus sp.]MCI1598432.1 GGDEF domain-containing protein [Levilactobacillus sp.]MCI1605799.1 GGDEF domain-containing protein [Levilactobacillus sp.]TGD18478.1 GGDEF domain-containing protein [Levilactobacillus suantsaiihabitans]